jgi:DNA repair protein RecO (recombination protein O)
MLSWSSPAIVLSVRPHGDADAIVEALSEHHGRYAGLLRGGGSRKHAAMLQPGNRVAASWSARLSEQLGGWQMELEQSTAPALFDDARALKALKYALSLMTLLPEREAHPQMFAALSVLLPTLSDPQLWPAVLIRFELGVLDVFGFGLDLSTCAGGGDDDLIYVSPRTGRAVSRGAGGPYADKLLSLPPFLLANQAAVLDQDLTAGYALTGYFLKHRVFPLTDKPLLAMREAVVTP